MQWCVCKYIAYLRCCYIGSDFVLENGRLFRIVYRYSSHGKLNWIRNLIQLFHSKSCKFCVRELMQEATVGACYRLSRASGVAVAEVLFKKSGSEESDRWARAPQQHNARAGHSMISPGEEVTAIIRKYTENGERIERCLLPFCDNGFCLLPRMVR